MRLPLNSKEFFKGGIFSFLGGFWDIDDSKLIGKSWDWNVKASRPRELVLAIDDNELLP
jgi:hypothetical protein